MAFVATQAYVPLIDGPSVAQAQEKKRGFFQRLFGRKKKPVIKTVEPQLTTEEQSEKNRLAAEAARRRANAPLPKIDDANRILVLGDTTAGVIAKGLMEGYKRTPSVVVSPRIKDDISVIGDQFYPWLDASEFTLVGERVKAVVVSIGTHDRFGFTLAGKRLAFGSEQWEWAYRRRLGDISAQLQLLNLPIIWILPPPVLDNENTEKLIAVGALQNAAVAPFGFRVVDVRGGFTDDNGKYDLRGANLKGKRVRLREHSGIGFTKSGTAKLAYYARREIDIILDEAVGQTLRLESGTKPSLTSQKIVILTRPALRQGAKLAGGNGRASTFYRDSRAREYFVDGKPLNPPLGRVDNFSLKEEIAKPLERAAIR